MKKITTKLWRDLGVGTAGVLGMALSPLAPAGESGESGQAAHGTAASEGGESGASVFPGNLDKAISNMFVGEGGEGGAGLTPMWPSVTAPALTGHDVEKVVTGNTLRTNGHVAWYFTPDKQLEGGFLDWKQADQKVCPATDDPKDAYYRNPAGECWTYKLYPVQGTWDIRDNQLCLNVKWNTGARNDCRYVTILLDDVALFDAQGKIDGKGMHLLKGKQIAE
jgi:hypothetical protein